jgi:hypothetical protein
MDEKKASLYHAGLTIHLQECLGMFTSLSYNVLVSAAIDQKRPMKAIAEADEKKMERMMLGSFARGVSSNAPPKYRMLYTPPGVSCANHNNSRIGAIVRNSNSGDSSSNSHNNSSSSSSTVLLLHRCNRLQSSHHNRLPTIIFRASTAGSWNILLVSASCQSKAIHLELWQPWSIIRGTHKGVRYHRPVVPITPPWMRFPREKKC